MTLTKALAATALLLSLAACDGMGMGPMDRDAPAAPGQEDAGADAGVGMEES